MLDGQLYSTVCSAKKWCHLGWCKKDYNINPDEAGAGYISYDNFSMSLLTLFQTLTNEGWVDVMYLFEASDKWASRLYHVLWVFMGAFFVMQLALAVLSDSFVQAQEAEKTEKEREALHKEALLGREESVKGFKPTRKHSGRRLSAVYLGLVRQSSSLFDAGASFKLSRKVERKPPFVVRMLSAVWARGTGVCAVLVNSSWFQNFILLCIVVNTVTMMLAYHDQYMFEDSICKRRCDLDPHLPAAAAASCMGPLFDRKWVYDGRGGRERPPQEAFCYLRADSDVALPAASRYHGANCSMHTTLASCNADRGVTGRGCQWFTRQGVWMGIMGQAQWWQDRSVPDSSHPDGRLAWFRDGELDPAAQAAAVEPEPEPAEGECRLGLYSPQEFAERADVGGAGAGAAQHPAHLRGKHAGRRRALRALPAERGGGARAVQYGADVDLYRGTRAQAARARGRQVLCRRVQRVRLCHRYVLHRGAAHAAARR